MNKQPLVLGLAVLLICVGLSGCNEPGGNSELDKFVGRWEPTSAGGTLIFSSDRTCYIGSLSGTYKLEEGVLVIDLAGGGGISILYDYAFSNNNTTLALTELGVGITTVYTKL